MKANDYQVAIQFFNSTSALDTGAISHFVLAQKEYGASISKLREIIEAIGVII